MKENYRKFETSLGIKVLAGKNAEQNESLVKEFMNKENIIMHTKARGSPFCVILKLKATEKELKEVAIFCAEYSRVWKKAKIKKDVEVHYFKGKDIFKTKQMKIGTFNVRKYKKIKVKKQDIESG